MVVMTNVYERFRAYHKELQSGAPMVRLLSLKNEQKISDEDFDIIKELIDAKRYIKLKA